MIQNLKRFRCFFIGAGEVSCKMTLSWGCSPQTRCIQWRDSKGQDIKSCLPVPELTVSQSELQALERFRRGKIFEEMRIRCRFSIAHTVLLSPSFGCANCFSPWAGGKMWWFCAAASLQAGIDAAYVSTTSNLFGFVSSCRGTWQGLWYLVIMYDATKIAAFRCILEPELKRSVSVFLCNSKQVESKRSWRDGTSTVLNPLIVRPSMWSTLPLLKSVRASESFAPSRFVTCAGASQRSNLKRWKALKLTYSQDHSGMFHVYIHCSHVICGRTFPTWLEGVQSCYGVASISFRFGCNSFWILHPIQDHSDHSLLFITYLSHYLSIVLDFELLWASFNKLQLFNHVIHLSVLVTSGIGNDLHEEGSGAPGAGLCQYSPFLSAAETAWRRVLRLEHFGIWFGQSLQSWKPGTAT